MVSSTDIILLTFDNNQHISFLIWRRLPCLVFKSIFYKVIDVITFPVLLNLSLSLSLSLCWYHLFTDIADSRYIYTLEQF